MHWWSVRLWGVHLLGLVCVAAAIGMGTWQYDAWQRHRAAEQLDLTRAEPMPITDVLGPDEPFPSAGLGRPVTVSGTFLERGTVLVTGREDDEGTQGRWVVTPLSVGAVDSPAVPVVSGWVSEDIELSDLPPAPTGEVDVTGWLQPTEVSSGRASAEQVAETHVMPDLRIADLIQLVGGQDLYGAYVITHDPLSADASAGLVAATLDQLPQAGTFTGLRNLLYAIEWWFFASFALFIWWRFVRDATRQVDLDEAVDESASPDDVLSTT